MTPAHAAALTSNLATAKLIFKNAMAATLSGVSASEITIQAIYADGVLQSRRLSNSTNSTNSSSTEATVRVEWVINSGAAVTASALTTGTSFKNAIVSEAASAGV